MKKFLSVLLILSMLLTPVASLAETWNCPVCGQENDGRFCPNDAQPRPVSAEEAAEGLAVEAQADDEPEAETAEVTEAHLTDYVDSWPDVSDLLWGADLALQDGMDPKQVGKELYALAEENGLTDALLWYGENLASYENDEYERFEEYFLEREQGILAYDYNMDKYGFDVYSGSHEYSDTLIELLGFENPQFCYSPVFWAEADFVDFYKVKFAKFTPSAPRPGYVCVVVKDSSQGFPETSWRDEPENMENAIYRSVGDIVYALEGENVPVFTGNPNLASEFWVFELKYPFYGNYGKSEPYVKGYHCSLSVTVTDAEHNKITSISTTNRLPDTISTWYNWIAQADVPEIQESGSFASFTRKLGENIHLERAKAVVGKKITAMNTESVVNGILAYQSESAKNGWEQAIYSGGARDVQLSGDMLTFRMRSYNPKISEMGKYAEAEYKTGWLFGVLNNATTYDLEISVPVKNGKITDDGMTALKSAVTKAADAAKKGFGGKDFKTALIEYYFPQPLDGKLKTAEDLMTPCDAFRERAMEMRGYTLAVCDVSDEAWAALFYAQNSQTLDVKGGPDAIVLSSMGAVPGEMAAKAAKTVLDAQAFKPKEERLDSDELEEAFHLALAEEAIAVRSKTSEEFIPTVTLTVSIDGMLAGEMPTEYEEYLTAFAYSETCDRLIDMDEQLLDIAAIKMPKTGKINAPSSGTSVTFKLSPDSDATYIMMRDTATDTPAATCFAAAGKSVHVNVPQGEYIIAWASGPYWYGEELLFGNLCAMNKSEPAEIKDSSYKHTFTLEKSDNGDVGFTDAKLSDFQ